jgi:hypothetical protein
MAPSDEARRNGSQDLQFHGNGTFCGGNDSIK